jgi:hypothetical protein
VWARCWYCCMLKKLLPSNGFSGPLLYIYIYIYIFFFFFNPLTNDRPDLSSERAPQIRQDRNLKKKINK